MKNIFDVVKGGNFAEISQGLNTALGGKLDTVIKNAGGMASKGGQAAQSAMGNASLGGVGGLLGATAVGGVIGALFGGKKAVKKMAKGAVLVGGTAAAGALAWNFYQKWAGGKAGSAPATHSGTNITTSSGQFGDAPAPASMSAPASSPAAPPAQPTQPAQQLTMEDATALILLEAMVFAARADGHIDAEEQAYIENAVESLFPDKEMSAVLHDLLHKPIDPMSLAAKVRDPEEAKDLYRLSCAAINVDSFMERSYLDGLAKALNIDEAQKNMLENEAAAVRQSMGE